MDQETHRRSHLTKDQRLPRTYKEVEKILNKVKKCEANVKTVLNSSRLRGAVFHKVSGLTFNVLKQSRILDSIIEKTQILEKEPYLRKELAGILIHELIFGNGLPGQSKPVETVLKYQDVIETTYNALKSDDSLFNNLITIPKYIRVNTLVTTLPEVVEDLECLGVRQIVFDVNISEDEFYILVKNLEKNTFLIDFHFKDLLIFHAEENLTSWPLYKKGHVFIQDKSSYIPAYVLDPPPGSIVLDACAAPGMKTLHLTALMENTGTLYAFERDPHRFEILNDMLKSGHASICQTFCGDFNVTDPKDETYSSVEYILLDPSCSGSGMVSRMDSITDTKDSKNDLRIQKLAGFQIILLKHALHFPNVKRVVYSTCSITETENEFVVHEVLNHFGHKFKLSPVIPDWSIRGSSDYEFGPLCLRAYPDKCLTNGFFVAMFERLEDFEVQEYFEKKQQSFEKKKRKRKSNEPHLHQKDKEFNEEEKFNGDNQYVKKERKNDIDITMDNAINKDEEEMLTKKKRRKHKKEPVNINEHTNSQDQRVETMNIENSTLNPEDIKPHKKKHKSKHGKGNSNSAEESYSLVEKEIQNSNCQDGNFVEDIKEINLLHEKKSKKSVKITTNTNLTDNPSLSVLTQDCVITDLLSEKQHKKKKQSKKDDSNSFCGSYSNVDHDSISVISPEIKTPEKKKKHKRKHEKKDGITSFDEIVHYNEENVLKDTVQVETIHISKKKHKRKHEKENGADSFDETQAPKFNQSNEESNILTETVQEEIVHKTEKKHKKKKDRK